VRLFTKNGHDWSKRYPWIVETALKIKQDRFVIDGEAVVVGVNGVSDFDALHSRQHDDEVQLYASRLAERITEIVALLRAGGDGGLQLHANLLVGVKIGFKQVALELRFCVNEGCLCSRMAAAQRLGASAQRREFGFEFFHRGFPFEQECHAASIGISK
jgi:hypothetical protein